MKTVYVKISNICNLNCKHCYINDKSESKLDVNAFLTWIENRYLEKYSQEEIEIVFHGGEPGLFPDEILLIISKLEKYSNLIFNITTNLVYDITKKHIDLLKKCNVATSFDAADIRFSDEDFLKWKNNCVLVSKIIDKFQLNVVLTSELLKINPDFLYILSKEIGINSIHFERLAIKGNAINLDVPSWEDVDEWLCKAYEIKPENIKVVEFEELELSYKFNKLSGCKLRQCSKDVLTINPNGTIATCPNQYEITFGSLISLKDIQESNDYKYFENKELRKNNKCYICDFYKYCNGDCFQLEWQNGVCPFPKKLFTKIKENYDRL